MNFAKVDYLFRGVYYRTIPDPPTHFGELGLVLEPKPVVDGPARDGLPFESLVALGEPFPGDICVELYLVGLSVVRGNLHGEERERDRLVY